MRKVVVELMTVTPLFLGGSDPRSGPPELRPPSFRGAMRYWYRAALGGVVGDDWKKVRQLEGKIFGITSDEEKEGRGSAVSVRVSLKRQITSRDYVKERRQPPSGKDYLFWSMAQTGSMQKGNYQPARKFIEEGFPFWLILSTQKFGSEADFYLKQAIYSLWLTVHLGGIGSRSRRMAGSLSPVKPFELEGLTFGLKGNDVSAIANELSVNLRQIRQSLIKDFGQSSPASNKPGFDILSPVSSKVWVIGKYRTAMDALNDIGKKMRDFRNRREPDHREVAKWLSGSKTKIQTVERVQFGLPIVYRYTNGPSGTIVAVVGGDDKIERRASPLWLSALRCPDGQIAVTAILFNSQFLPSNAYLAIDKKNYLGRTNPPGGLEIVEAWIKDQFPHRKEVNYA